MYRDHEFDPVTPEEEARRAEEEEFARRVRREVRRMERGEADEDIRADEEREAEERLLKDADKAVLLSDVDVLQVAHHGANTSSTPAFLLQSMPAIALISVGENAYGHPAGEVLERLESLDAHIFSTRENATIELSTVGDGIFSVHTARGGTT